MKIPKIREKGTAMIRKLLLLVKFKNVQCRLSIK